MGASIASQDHQHLKYFLYSRSPPGLGKTAVRYDGKALSLFPGYSSAFGRVYLPLAGSAIWGTRASDVKGFVPRENHSAMDSPTGHPIHFLAHCASLPFSRTHSLTHTKLSSPMAELSRNRSRPTCGRAKPSPLRRKMYHRSVVDRLLTYRQVTQVIAPSTHTRGTQPTNAVRTHDKGEEEVCLIMETTDNSGRRY